MADYNSDRTGSNIDLTLDKVDVRDTVIDINNNTATRVTIADNGNIGIGTASPNNTVQINTSINGGGLTLQRDSITQGDYSQLSFAPSTSPSAEPRGWIRGHRGSVSTNTYLTFGTDGSERARIDSSGNLLVGTTSSPTGSGQIVANNGIYLGGTGAANKLDDYEEGIWTPTLGSLTTGSTFTYSLQSGSYVKVGRKVTVNGNIVLTNASGGSGSIVVSSLPFTISSNGATRPSGVIGYCGLLLNGTASILLGSNGTTYAAIYRADPSEVSHVAVPRTDIDGNEIFRFSLTYETDS